MSNDKTNKKPILTLFSSLLEKMRRYTTGHSVGLHSVGWVRAAPDPPRKFQLDPFKLFGNSWQKGNTMRPTVLKVLAPLQKKELMFNHPS